MASIKSSPHFVPLGRVPLVDDVVPVASAFAATATSGAGGFILRQRAEPRFYVFAAALARHIETTLGAGAWEKMGKVATLQVVERAQGWIEPVTKSPAVVPVAPQPVEAEADVAPYQSRPDTVFVVTEFGTQTGWLFNHEPLVATVNTPPPTFRCTRGHSNADPDSGSCYRCPAPVTMAP